MATRPEANQAQAQDRMAAMAAAIAEIKPVSEAVSPARIVVYARNKVGKTRFGASSGKKTLILCADPYGIETLASLKAPNVDYVQIKEWKEVEPYYWFLATQDHDYEVLVFDTWTMLTTMCMRYVMGQETNRDPLMPKTDHWMKLAQIMNNDLLSKWAYLPMDVVWLCQERNFTSKKEGEEDETVDQIGPATSPSVAWTLIGAVGTVGHLFKKEVEVDGKRVIQRRMRFEDPENLYICGTRVRGLPTIMANPTLKAILDIRAKTGELPPDETLFGESYAVDEDEETSSEAEEQSSTPRAGVMTL